MALRAVTSMVLDAQPGRVAAAAPMTEVVNRR